MTHKKFSKEELFMKQGYRRIKDQKPWPRLALNQDFAQRRELKPVVKNMAGLRLGLQPRPTPKIGPPLYHK